MKMENRFMNGGLVALAVVVFGVLLSVSISGFVDSNRVVSVRGLSEREVSADMVLWPMVYTQTGNDLVSINAQIQRKNDRIVEFLNAAGIEPSEYTINAITVADLDADRYSSNRKGFRYLATQLITVSSSQVGRIVELQRQGNQLLKYGITLSQDSYKYPTEFIFTRLNDIKPEMIQQATENAREAAEKFAEDSGSSVGQISRATQGQFSISDRDRYTPQIKRVRVVTYVDYFLD